MIIRGAVLRSACRPTPRIRAGDGIAVLEKFNFVPNGGQGEGIPLGMAENKQTVRSQELRKIRIVKQTLGEGSGTPADIFLAVRRIGKNQIELSSGAG